MVVSFEGDRVLAQGLQPGASAVLLGAGRDHERHAPRLLVRAELVDDADGDGAVELALGQRVPARSVWLLVDAASGSFAVAAPEGSLASPAPATAGQLVAARDGTGDAYCQPAALLLVALVRPGVGAWARTVGDGGASDADRVSNGVASVALGGLRPLGPAGPAPATLDSGDLLVAIDLDTLRYFVRQPPSDGEAGGRR